MGFFDWFYSKQEASSKKNRTWLVERLLDRSNDAADRGMAAETLGGHADHEASIALLKVILDETDDFNVREEAAASLGWIFKRKGIDHEAMAKIPERFRMEMNLSQSC